MYKLFLYLFFHFFETCRGPRTSVKILLQTVISHNMWHKLPLHQTNDNLTAIPVTGHWSLKLVAMPSVRVLYNLYRHIHSLSFILFPYPLSPFTDWSCPYHGLNQKCKYCTSESIGYITFCLIFSKSSWKSINCLIIFSIQSIRLSDTSNQSDRLCSRLKFHYFTPQEVARL